MKIRVNKTTELRGEALVPSSKSQSIRGLIMATLAKGKSILHNVLQADDVMSAITVCEGIGANIVRLDGDEHGLCLGIRSAGVPFKIRSLELNSGNSGISTRFILPAIGLRRSANTCVILDVKEQMRKRPVKPLIEALNNLGMNIKSQQNGSMYPLEITGQLIGGRTSIEGLTSQYLSALLLSCPLAKGDTEIIVNDLRERPYVDMTLQWLNDQQVKYKHIQEGNKDIFKIKGRHAYKPIQKRIQGDFSSASYLIAAAVMIPGVVALRGLYMDDWQGDKRLLEVLRGMGAKTEWRRESGEDRTSEDVLVIKGGNELTGIKVDCGDMPDMLPTLAVIGAYTKGKTEIVNVRQARIKETDRIHSMCDGLRNMGAKIDENEDGLTVYQSGLSGAKVHGYNDHRTIMALSLAGMLAEGETIIDNAEGISKTFPGFVELMKNLGGKMEKIS